MTSSLASRRALRVHRHRATTAHLCSAYPFLAEAGLGPRGVYLGTNLLTGGGGFAFDPFEAYAAGTLTNPNMLLAGEVGVGKSATAKAFIYRSVGVFGRWVAIADPKGEYLPLAEALGLDVIKLHPGGTARINPLDPGPAGLDDGPDELARRQAALVGALLGSVLRRDPTPVEDAVLGWAVGHLARTARNDVTLADVATVMASPTEEMTHLARTDAIDLARSVEAAIYGLGKLLDRSLRGMFDGPTTVHLDWNGPGIVLDLSAVHNEPEALTLVMIATTAWLQAVLARPDGPPRLQVLDEAWSLLSSERTTRYLQACWKLSRAYGVANLAIVHRLSDLRAQADDGTAASKLSMGLLADTQTRVLFRQSTDQVHDATELLGLTASEALLLPRLAKGRALWKVGDRTAVVAHVIGTAERWFCDTDARMAAR
ncbi:MAG: ATP-binding protein [Actinomycetota bacterium]|nr:ATP-binding protein [Actinomycetota bacterium]